MQLRSPVDFPLLDWCKSSLCQNSECVEIAAYGDGTVLMRNSSGDESTYVSFTPQEFGAFLEDAKAGRFDALAPHGNLRFILQ